MAEPTDGTPAEAPRAAAEGEPETAAVQPAAAEPAPEPSTPATEPEPVVRAQLDDQRPVQVASRDAPEQVAQEEPKPEPPPAEPEPLVRSQFADERLPRPNSLDSLHAKIDGLRENVRGIGEKADALAVQQAQQATTIAALAKSQSDHAAVVRTLGERVSELRALPKSRDPIVVARPEDIPPKAEPVRTYEPEREARARDTNDDFLRSFYPPKGDQREQPPPTGIPAGWQPAKRDEPRPVPENDNHPKGDDDMKITWTNLAGALLVGLILVWAFKGFPAPQFANPAGSGGTGVADTRGTGGGSATGAGGSASGSAARRSDAPYQRSAADIAMEKEWRDACEKENAPTVDARGLPDRRPREGKRCYRPSYWVVHRDADSD